MSVFETTRFEGALVGNGANVPVVFDAGIDDRGTLQLRLDPLSVSDDALGLSRGLFRGRKVEHLSLTGSGPNGETFASDSFFITSFNHRSGRDVVGELIYGGRCSEARVERPLTAAAEKPQVVWLIRQLQTFRRLARETPHGRVEIAGAKPEDDPQALTGYIAVEASGAANAPWWTTADHLLHHVSRVISLACGTYFRTYVERRLEGSVEQLRVFGRSDTAKPFLPPFHVNNLEPIFSCACDSYDDRFEKLRAYDAALQWLLVPAHYEEIRLLTAMTALENIVDVDAGGAATIMKPSPFRRVAKAVRECLTKIDAPQAMLVKLPELNRPSFADKIQAYIDNHDIVVHDFPAEGLRSAIKARNDVVHRGIYFDENVTDQLDIWDHILVSRELIVRILLVAIGFEGNYFSLLHGDQQISFPGCQPLTAF